MVRKSSKGIDKRTFTLEDAVDHKGCRDKVLPKGYIGNYLGSSPMQAARKALTKICQLTNVKGRCSYFIVLRETTQGSSKKVFIYKVRREKLDEPGPFGNEYRSVAKSVKSFPGCKTDKSKMSVGKTIEKSPKRRVKHSVSKKRLSVRKSQLSLKRKNSKKSPSKKSPSKKSPKRKTTKKHNVKKSVKRGGFFDLFR